VADDEESSGYCRRVSTGQAQGGDIPQAEFALASLPMLALAGVMTQEDGHAPDLAREVDPVEALAAADGLVVMLGRHETAEEAHADRGPFAEQGTTPRRLG
jgi:hypothetical protein